MLKYVCCSSLSLLSVQSWNANVSVYYVEFTMRVFLVVLVVVIVVVVLFFFSSSITVDEDIVVVFFVHSLDPFFFFLVCSMLWSGLTLYASVFLFFFVFIFFFCVSSLYPGLVFFRQLSSSRLLTRSLVLRILNAFLFVLVIQFSCDAHLSHF